MKRKASTDLSKSATKKPRIDSQGSEDGSPGSEDTVSEDSGSDDSGSKDCLLDDSSSMKRGRKVMDHQFYVVDPCGCTNFNDPFSFRISPTYFI